MTSNQTRSCLTLLVFLCLSAATAFAQPANSQESVYRFFSSLKSFRADFTQHVVDSDGNPIQESQGEVWIQRPGRFRWNYQTPYKQEVVANGVELWTYDPELEQATVKPIDQVLSVTPAMLLSGVRELREIATLNDLGERDDLHWYQVLPLKPDEAVDQVQLAFRNDSLAAIRVNDSFGNTTTIQFSGEQKNKPVPDTMFNIELPAGTDILGAE